MTETRKLQLHVGKCIEDLDKMHNVPDLKAKRATLLCKTAQKLFEKAEEYRTSGDEEYAYVYYMKYLRVVAFLSKEKDYQKDKSYFNGMLGAKNPSKAIDAAEHLKISLIERYSALSRTLRAEAASPPLPAAAPAPATPEPVFAALHTMTLPDADEVMIECDQLFPLIRGGNVGNENNNRMRVMILDTRPAAHFEESHINVPGCISVPEECISPGQSAHVLEQALPQSSRAVWSARASMELIVMLDWNSDALIPGSTLFLLKTILLKWDVKVHYARAPLALRGGYCEWVDKYPALTTNPRPTTRSQPSVTSRSGHHQDMLGDISYPSWAEVSAALATPPAVLAPPTSRHKEPIVDRSSKAAAVQTYTERARGVQRLLDQQERLADTSLSVEMERLEAEQDWERVRTQCDTEQRQELRDQYELREQEIISRLMQLENRQYDMEQENQTLREQLEEYQRREREDAAKEVGAGAGGSRAGEEVVSVCAAAKRSRIAAVRERRATLHRQREAMELERKRRLSEARGKDKPLGRRGEQDEDGDAYMTSPCSSPHPRHSPDTTPQEEVAAPTFDRSQKPMRSPDIERERELEHEREYEREHEREPDVPADRERDFEPIFGNVGLGLTGLKNLGNTCYMNSVLQCLNNTDVLVSYFCSDQYREHINRSHPTRGQVAEEMAALVRALWAGHYRYLAAKELRAVLGRHQRAFRSGEQQDAHEFLTILMDWLHQDLQVTVSKRSKSSSGSGSLAAWQQFTGPRSSVPLRLFYGQIRSTVRCGTCGRSSLTYETFSNLSLELPGAATRCRLADCLQLYLQGETVRGWHCPVCKVNRDATKKLDIARLPPVLVIHFKRFYLDASAAAEPKCEKKLTYIDFPLTGLDMRPFALPPAPPSPGDEGLSPLYDLYAVSNHYGSTQSGHYTAACRSSVYSKWYMYDDHAVSEILPNEVKSSAAYILFYTACRAPAPPV